MRGTEPGGGLEGWGGVLAGGCVSSITLNHGTHHGQMLRVSSAGQGQSVVSDSR